MTVAASLQVGEWYDMGKFLCGFMDIPHAEICTTYVQKCYEAAHCKLAAGAGRLVTPNELAEDPKLTRVS